MKSPQTGFTFLEILIAISIGALIVTITLAGFSSFNKRYVLKGDAEMLTVLIRDARARTILGKEGLQYGVHIGSTTSILFRGASFNQSAPTNEAVDFNSKVAVGTTTINGGGYDIVFARLKGTTVNYGTTTLYLIDDPSVSRSIIIRESGIVEMQ